MFGDRLWDVGRARVKAVDHHGLHRDRLVKPFEIELIEPGLSPDFELAVFFHFLTPLAFTGPLCTQDAVA
jgi:hypothetical protein